MKNRLFAPYQGTTPAAVDINGHRLIILSRSRRTLEESLEVVGADNIRQIQSGGTNEEQEATLYRLAQEVQGGVVVAPTTAGMADVIRNLEAELPWIQ